MAETASATGFPSSESTCGIERYALRLPLLASPAWWASSNTTNEMRCAAAKRATWICRNSGVVSSTSTVPSASAANTSSRSVEDVSPVSTATLMPSAPNDSARWNDWSLTSARSG